VAATLTDRPRPLGGPRFAPEDRLKVVAVATAVPPGADTGLDLLWRDQGFCPGRMHRLHSSLGYRSSAHYETAHAA
jgi:hypothetical protein